MYQFSCSDSSLFELNPNFAGFGEMPLATLVTCRPPNNIKRSSCWIKWDISDVYIMNSPPTPIGMNIDINQSSPIKISVRATHQKRSHKVVRFLHTCLRTRSKIVHKRRLNLGLGGVENQNLYDIWHTSHCQSMTSSTTIRERGRGCELGPWPALWLKFF